MANASVDEKKEVPPGQLGDDGKYTDEGIAALVDKIAKGDDESKEEKKAEKKAEKKDEKMVPISRLNEVINERNKLRDQVGKPAPVAKDAPPTVAQLRTQLNTKRTEWQKALMDNDADVATALLSDLNKLEAQLDDTRSAEVRDTSRALSADDIKYDALLEKLLTDFPIIDKTSDTFDQEVVTEVYDMREAYIAAGHTQTEALKMASKYVLQPRVKQRKVKERTTDSKRVLVDALDRQPTDVSDVGDSADKINNNKFGIDITRLKPEQFDKLSPEIKSELRGDKVQEHHLGFKR
jgi:hypothetical protein